MTAIITIFDYTAINATKNYQYTVLREKHHLPSSRVYANTAYCIIRSTVANAKGLAMLPIFHMIQQMFDWFCQKETFLLYFVP